MKVDHEFHRPEFLQGEEMKHDIRHVMSLQEMLMALIEAGRERPASVSRQELPVKIATGPGKHQVYLISSIYYSPETQTIFIDAEN